jgi:cyanobactin maturation PatA/PatG family protease
MSCNLQHHITNSLIPGLNELWAECLGDPRICVAVLDGPVDLSHPNLAAANLTRIETLASGIADQGPASQHGTHIASVIFGQHDGPVKGIAPHCRGLIIPVFKDRGDGSIAPCSQLDLARAISAAMQEDAHIINISGGELTPSGTAHPILSDAVRDCTNSGVLIVAAAGNEGCDCLHIPGALPSVLTVGAMSGRGEPLDFSNWGDRYQTQGILAPGEEILGASSGGETVRNSGTSYATPVVSGIAALLLSLQLKHRQKPDPPAVRAAILSSAVRYDEGPAPDPRRVLVGRLNVGGAMSQIVKEVTAVSESNKTQEDTLEGSGPTAPAIQPAHTHVSESGKPSPSKSTHPAVSTPSSQRDANTLAQGSVVASNITAAACECGGGSGAPAQMVFAIGQLGFDFGTEARRDSIMQHMDPPANPQEPNQLLAYLEKNPWDTAAILWTLNLDATPIYAMQGQGAFASDVYRRLREFLGEEAKGEVERVSISGYIAGNARLLTGQIVPIIWPVLRGMYSWNTTALIAAVGGTAASEETQGVANFLRRVYEELRNLGVTPQERAINYSATNTFQVNEVFKDAIKEGMDLDTIEVERSPICRLDSDCWDVKLTFFSPRKMLEQARKVYRFTVDVSDVVPVTVGPVRSWFVR